MNKIQTLLTTTVLLFGISGSSVADYKFDWGLIAYESEDYKRAFNEWKAEAEQGDASAQYYIGGMYAKGQGVLKDLSKAKYWIKKAYENPKISVRTKDKEDVEKAWNDFELWKYSPSTTPNKIPGRDYSSGTGFYINKKGMMITNNHVVKSCSKIKVDGSNAVAESFDATNDLALLQVDSTSLSAPSFRTGKGIRLGDGVTVAGYPLRGVLGSGLNVVTGSVASLSGIKNDSSKLQITAPVNSGNSGGPMFDSSGRVVGVIVSKINNTKAREILGEEIQGANFAIKGSVVKSFLDMNDVDYEVSSSDKSMSTADIAENAKKYTSLIKCWK